MKKLFIIFSLFFSVAQAQQNCNNNVLTPAEFNSKYAQLAKQQGDRYKLDFCTELMRNKCLTSMQVKQFAMLFNNENSRLQFAGEAFLHTVDAQNYYEVYDAFKNFSTAFKLHDIIYGTSIPAPPKVVVIPEPPHLIFPLCDNYKGPKGCGLPLADNDFELISKGIGNQPNDMLRAQAALNLIKANCISMAQLMRLCMGLEMESNRLAFLKEAFAKVYDQGNYSYAAEVFSHIPYKNDWMDYAENKLTPTLPPVVVCTVTPAEFDQIKSSINKESVSSVRITITKQILSAKKCFTCVQVKEIVNLMSFESGKVEIAKYAYDFTIDKENYYTVADAFSFSSSKEDLMKFIKGKN
ncbi:MAG: DUF4476 domain-containing protein [Bacteroidia bacterium]